MHRRRPERLTDDQLLDALAKLNAKHNLVLAELLDHLAEVDERGLYAERGFSSLHKYCVEVLNMSDDQAYARIQVARAGRRVPALLERIADGRLHLTGARLLAPHLHGEDVRALLDEASGQTRDGIKAVLARRHPKPDVPTSIRKLPIPAAPVSPKPSGPEPPQPTGSLRPEAPAEAKAPSASGRARPVPPLRLAAPAPARIEPLAPGRYQITFTASQGMVDALQRAAALLSHAIPARDTSAVLERCLGIACEQLVKRRFGAEAVADEVVPEPVVEPSSAGAPDAPAPPRTRHIPAAVRAAVWRRDGGQCTYTDPKTGRACGERRHLELHHEVPFARGGVHDASTITLRCAAHNAMAARHDFGRAHVARRIEERRNKPPRREQVRP